MEPESSLPYSQVPATFPYPEPTPSSLQPLPIPEDPSLYRILTFHVPKRMSLFLLRDTSPRNTPPQRSEWGISLPPDCFVSRGSISPCEYFLTMFFHGEALLAPRPTPKAGWPPLVGCPRLLIQYIRSYPPYRRPFLHPQPEDAIVIIISTQAFACVRKQQRPR